MSQTSDPTHPPRTFGTPLSEKEKLSLFCFLGCLEHFIFLKKWEIFRTKFQNSKIFGALKHHEMARYDLPTYVLHVLGHFWMFAVKITEWIFSLKSLGLWTWTWTHLPIVWDKVPKKIVFFTPFLRVSDWQSKSGLDSICNTCDVYITKRKFSTGYFLYLKKSIDGTGGSNFTNPRRHYLIHVFLKCISRDKNMYFSTMETKLC